MLSIGLLGSADWARVGSIISCAKNTTAQCGRLSADGTRTAALSKTKQQLVVTDFHHVAIDDCAALYPLALIFNAVCGTQV